jgi:hypothetical protein
MSLFQIINSIHVSLKFFNLQVFKTKTDKKWRSHNQKYRISPKVMLNVVKANAFNVIIPTIHLSKDIYTRLLSLF